jgi:hypothetical protein
MKVKFIIILILILGIGGSAFYFGWIQFRLEEHSCGVIFTKTGGYEEEVVRPGEFTWRWEALIPTNLTLHKIDVSPHGVNVHKEGQLPSGDIYGEVLEKPVDFSYSVDLRFEYALVAEKLPELVRERGLRDDGLDELYADLDRELTNRVLRFIESRIESADTEVFMSRGFAETLKKDLQDSSEHVEILQVSLNDLMLPDIRLYRSSRDYYLGLLEARRKTETAALEREREWMVSEESKLEVYRKYGELFTEYPGLVNFLALCEGENLDKVLPAIDLIREETSAEAGQLE